jgi:hypothetical protein
MAEKNRKKLKVEFDGREVEVHVLKPNNKVIQDGTAVYNRAFLQAVKPSDGGRGAITRPALESVLREQKVWDDARQAEYERLVDVYGAHPEIPMPLVEYIYGTLESGKLLAAGGGPVEWEPSEEKDLHIPEAVPAPARRKRA